MEGKTVAILESRPGCQLADLPLARRLGSDGSLATNLNRTLIASIGPVCSAALRGYGVNIGLEAKPPKLGPLVAALDPALSS